ncbi:MULTISPECIES: hypothetical protein [Streptomyces]|uniref:hypothetical protein n=1 Tax=Streptomyces TaxID=1883 RepID=UPI0007216B3C|nr:hypothetical protein [Streptomyces sp. FR-008]ALM38203.1 hypothetical protein SFR_1588 [Streptomyces sp. FR-008]KAF0795849.1 hypothetical protein P405_00360 [Streptomyces sp. FR-008]
MIRPQLTADGRAVRLPIAARAESLLDDLALAFVEDPDTLGALLTEHGKNVRALDHAIYGHDVPEYDRAMRAAAADGSREALVDEVPLAGDLDDLLDPDAAISLAGRITRLAAHIRHRTAPEGTARP